MRSAVPGRIVPAHANIPSRSLSNSSSNRCYPGGSIDTGLDSLASDRFMTILFIGGTGNISAECVAPLIQRGHEVIVLSRGHSAVPRGCRAIQADRKNRGSLQAAT